SEQEPDPGPDPGLRGQPRSPRVTTSRSGPTPLGGSGGDDGGRAFPGSGAGPDAHFVGGSGRPARERPVDLRLPGGSARCVGAQSAGGRGEMRTAEKSGGGRTCTVGGKCRGGGQQGHGGARRPRG